MAKELPYFKFEPNQWENGNIQYFNRSVKGLFVDLCSMYWSRLGDLDYALALQKLCGGNTTELDLLMQRDIFVIVEDKIIIEFLDEQLNEFQETSDKRRDAANKRWNNASALQKQSKSNAIREDKSKEDKIIKENIKDINIRKREFYNSLIPFLDFYSKEMLKDFFDYWSEHGEKDKKFRKEKEKSFNIELRLKTWYKRSNEFKQKNNSSKPMMLADKMKLDYGIK